LYLIFRFSSCGKLHNLVHDLKAVCILGSFPVSMNFF
jgi:hypothetical protein